MAYTNSHRMARISPTKVRGLTELIKGKSVAEAMVTLDTSKKRGAVFLAKCLKAAVNNADQAEADIRRLIVTDARVDSGPTIKRFRPKDRGRAHSILKRTSHITVSVDVA